MLATETYSDIALDALKEIANIGAGHAASALSLMLENCVTISITSMNLNDSESLLSDLLPSDVFSFCHSFSGKLSGEIWIKISKHDADLIALNLLHEAAYGPEQLLSEVTHILAGSYITALSNLFDLELDLLPPHHMNESPDFTLNFQNTLQIAEREIGCSIQLVLSQDSLNQLLATCQLAR